MNARGFTLLEVLVAMSIFAIISLGANQMLQSIIASHEQTGSSTEALIRMTRGMNRIQTDLVQVVARPVRDEFGDSQAPLMVSGGTYLLEFTRAGWRNPLGRPRSELQRVAYDFVDGKLTRYFWLVLDRAEDSEPVVQTIFEDVDDFRVNLLDEQGNRTDVWPDFNSEQILPAAVEMIVILKGEGEIRRLVPLAAAAVNEPGVGGTGQGAGSGEDQTGQPEDARGG